MKDLTESELDGLDVEFHETLVAMKAIGDGTSKVVGLLALGEREFEAFLALGRASQQKSFLTEMTRLELLRIVENIHIVVDGDPVEDRRFVVEHYEKRKTQEHYSLSYREEMWVLARRMRPLDTYLECHPRRTVRHSRPKHYN